MPAEKQIKIADRMPVELFIFYADCDKLKWNNDTLGIRPAISLSWKRRRS
jgi:hypothetical protein